jgi:ferredoxin-NADP reductase
MAAQPGCYLWDRVSLSAAALIPVRLSRVESVAEETCLFELATLRNEPLPPASAGAHIDLHLPQGFIRQYSVLTPLSNFSSYVVAVKREPSGRGASRCLHDLVAPGATLQVSAPRNHFPLNENARDTLLLAGGIGITPIFGMFERLRQLGRSVRLHYWTRSVRHALFGDRLAACASAAIHVPIAGRKTLTNALRDVEADCEIYCCGPPRMLQEFAATTRDRPAQRIHIERFAAVGDSPQGWDFTVFLAKSQREVRVRSGESILEALRNASVPLSYSCEEGVCGACEVKYLEGTPVHRDSVRPATEHERLGTVMICCAGCRSERLTVDL